MRNGILFVKDSRYQTLRVQPIGFWEEKQAVCLLLLNLFKHIAVSWQKGKDLEQVLKKNFPAKLEIWVEQTGDSMTPYMITSDFK